MGIFLLNLLVFILVLGIIILLHELGHFFVAKQIGVLCHEYSIGMGPALYKYKKGETTYSIRAIPIGGYVSLAGEDNNFAMIKENDMIGLRFDEDKKVSGIVLSYGLESEVIGKVKSYELFDRNKKISEDSDEVSGLYIELELESGEIVRYTVLDNAKYYYGKEKELQIAPKERSLNSKPKWQRFLVMFAGPLMNFVLAILLFIVAFAITGKPVQEAKIAKTIPNGPLASVVDKNFTVTEINGISITTWDELSKEIYNNPGSNITLKIEGKDELVSFNSNVLIHYLGVTNVGKEEEQLVIGSVGGTAEKSGLEPGDKIIEYNATPVTTWKELTTLVDELDSSERNVTLTVERMVNSSVEQLPVSYKTMPKDTFIGQGVNPYEVLIGVERATKFNLGYAFKMGFVSFGDNALKIFRVLGGLFTPKTSGIAVTDLAGPIGIFNLIAQVRAGGFVAILIFMGFLSVNIGLVNLLPIPALDGGRILFLGIEAVTRKPINQKVETWVNNIAFMLLMALFVLIMIFDIIRIF